jgi:hypothetical protein
MSGDIAVNPRDVYVEPSILDRAKGFIDGIDDLVDWDSDYKKDAADFMARMMTAVDVTLFMSEAGSTHSVSVACRLSTGKDKILVVWGERTDEGVDKYLGWLDPEQLELIKSE